MKKGMIMPAGVMKGSTWHLRAWALRGVLLFLLGLGLAIPAHARFITSTRTKTFLVPGRTPAALLAALAKNGPRVSGHLAYARTRMKSTVEAGFVADARGCRISRVDVNVKFEILVPRARDYAAFPPAVKRDWRRFRRHLIWHEKQHRRIWLSCLKRLEKDLRTVRASNCTRARRIMRRLHRAALKRCDRLHDRFDIKERRRTRRMPFVRRALGPAGKAGS